MGQPEIENLLDGLKRISPDGAIIVADWASQSPYPESALLHLQRWLTASGNPVTHLQHLADSGPLAPAFLKLLSSSDWVGDTLAQNPELADQVLDPQMVGIARTSQFWLSEGRQLLRSASSHQHQLDRIRFLKQWGTIGLSLEEVVGGDTVVAFTGISDLANALLTLTLEAVWAQYQADFGLDCSCPMFIVGYGKLGGRELNYSSDVDLVYVHYDEPEVEERHILRLAERLSRAIEQSMGRGGLYRVDMRLRPYGAQGPLVSSFKGIENYYAKYAESWEHLALIRSSPITTDTNTLRRWEEMRSSVCFKRSRGEWVVQELLETRARIEGLVQGIDLKRSAGGIRDVEFLVQIEQMLGGARHPELQTRSTLKAIEALVKIGRISSDAAESLSKGLVRLRQVEHRLQLRQGLQVHSLPDRPEELDRLASTFGQTGESLHSELQDLMATIRSIYQQHFGDRGRGASDDPFTGENGPALKRMLDGLPGGSEYMRVVGENRDSRLRLSRLATRSPALLPQLARFPELVEEVISGEIEDRPTPQLKSDQQLSREILAAQLRYTFDDSVNLGESLSNLADQALLLDFPPTLVLLGFGSYASLELSINSDLDIVILRKSDDGDSERDAIEWKRRWTANRQGSKALQIDLRLRPEGNQGPLAPSIAAFEQYSKRRMETWERFALARSRAITPGSEPYLNAVRQIAFSPGLTPENVQELIQMKRRIETERVAVQHLNREIKLGLGGIDDIVWATNMWLMARPELGRSVSPSTPARIECLAQNGLLSPDEASDMQLAHTHLLKLRTAVLLLDFEPDLLPENPDRLAILAEIMGFEGANELLGRDNAIRGGVRAVLERTFARLS